MVGGKYRTKILLFLMFLAPGLSAGASFNIMPLRLFLVEGQKASSFTVHNSGGSKVRLQVQAFVWTQTDDGKEKMESTKDIILFPQIFDLDNTQDKAVRVGYQGLEVKDMEKAYRIQVVELWNPETGTTLSLAQPETNIPMQPVSAQLHVVVGMVSPLFIRPKSATPIPALQKIELRQDKLTLWIANTGNAHAYLPVIGMDGLDAAGKVIFTREIQGWSVLPGSMWPISTDVSRAECLQISSIRIHAEARGDRASAFDGKLPVTPDQCPGK